MVFPRLCQNARWSLATVLVITAFFFPINPVWAGPFSPDGDQAGSNGVIATSPLIQEWASSVVSYNPGPDVPGGTVYPTFNDLAYATQVAPGPSSSPTDPGVDDADVVSLGSGGSITLSFAQPITNGPGADFAVYTNKFKINDGNPSDYFLELATVAVSSNGVNFFTFPSVSLTQTTTQIGAFGALDPTNLYNLAGSEITGYGTPFNLDDLAGVSPLLNINDITEIRLTDVVGNVSLTNGDPVSYDDASNPIFANDSFYTGLNNVINAPFTTPYASSGFSLAGVAVLSALVVPEPSVIWFLLLGLGALSVVRRYLSKKPEV